MNLRDAVFKLLIYIFFKMLTRWPHWTGPELHHAAGLEGTSWLLFAMHPWQTLPQRSWQAAGPTLQLLESLSTSPPKAASPTPNDSFPPPYEALSNFHSCYLNRLFKVQRYLCSPWVSSPSWTPHPVRLTAPRLIPTTVWDWYPEHKKHQGTSSDEFTFC